MKTALSALGLLVVLGGLTPAARQAAAQTAETLMGQALHQEEVEGDLEAAIASYKRVVAEPKASRTTIANALLHLGRCYERLGNAESRKAFERLTREFSDQPQAAEARARLARTNGSQPIATMALKKVWSGPKVDPDGTISPDGRSLSFVDWETGDLAIHDFVTGANRRVTDNKTAFTATNDFVEESAISRDGARIAYSQFSGVDQRYSLWVVGFRGRPQPRRIFADDDVLWIGPYDWSPDGKWIAVQVQRKNQTSQLALVSVQDGSIRVLKTLDGAGSSKLLFSPDGTYLSFDLPVAPTRRPDVFLIAPDGTNETRVVDNAATDLVMGWTPDGRRLLFASDRNGSKGLWSVRIVNGAAEGVPELLRRDVDGYPLGVSSTGTLYFAMAAGDRDVRTAEIDFGTGQLVTKPTAAVESYVGANQQPEWSRDGKFLAYVSGRDAVMGANRVLAIRSLETGQVREVPVPLGYFTWPHWSPDGRFLVAFGRDLKGRQGIFRIDSTTGDATPIAYDEPDLGSFGPEVSPDGKRVHFRRFATAGGERRFIERDLDSGIEREIFRRRGLGAPAVSPDGRFVAAVAVDSPQSSTLLLIPTAGGDALELFRQADQPRGQLGTWVSWMPDGASIIVNAALDGADKRRQVWLVPTNGGAARKLDLTLNDNVPVRVHPDGRRIAFVAGQARFEVWALERFLSPSLTTR